MTAAQATTVRFTMGLVILTLLHTASAAADLPKCERVIHAEVVALDQPLVFNRMGSSTPDGMIYALKRDVVSKNGKDRPLRPGEVMLRDGKRPRPLVLRMNVRDCLEIRFTNLLVANPTSSNAPVTRYAGIHLTGLELVPTINPDDGKPLDGIKSNAANVGQSPSSLAAPGETKVYRWLCPEEGTFLVTTYADTTDAGASPQSQTIQGLFGAVNVQPRGAEYYRSQVTHDDLLAANYCVVPTLNGFELEGRETVTLTDLETDPERLLAGQPEPGAAPRPPFRKMTLSRVDRPADRPRRPPFS